MSLLRLNKVAATMSAEEKRQFKETDLGPGLPERHTTLPPKITKPQVWEFSAHPHMAERAGPHIDMRLGDRSTGIAHSFVLPKRTELPGPGESVRVIPTYDHRIEYMDYTGRISTPYGKGEVLPGRRTQTEVYHSEPADSPGTKLRFNLYDQAAPEEFSLRKDDSGKWFLHNKTQTREKRPDIPSFKPTYKEINIDSVDPTNDQQAMMPKLDGAQGIVDLQAGRAPRVFSYREGKVAKTGLIEHTHKMPELLKMKVPKELDGTMLRAEIVGVDKDQKAIPVEAIGGLLNSRVWESRRQQEATGVQLKPFPFSVVRYKGKNYEDAPFDQKLDVLQKVTKALKGMELPQIATTPEDKIDLLNKIRAKQYPLTQEGVVLVNKTEPGAPIKAKFAPDFDVYVRGIHAAKKKGGGEHERAGSISYSWTPDGPIVGQLGGFKHDEAKEMLQNPGQYIGRVAKVKATKVFQKGDELGALFQPRFKEWHLDKGDIEKSSASDLGVLLPKALLKKEPTADESLKKLVEINVEKSAMWAAFADELDKISAARELSEELKEFTKKVKPSGIKIIYAGPARGAGHMAQAKNLAAEAERQGIPYELVNYDERFLTPEFQKKDKGVYEGMLKGTKSLLDMGRSHAGFLATAVDQEKLQKFVHDNKDQAFIVTMPHLQIPFRDVNHPVHVLHTDPVKWHGEMDWTPLSANKRIHIGMADVLKDLKPEEGYKITGLPVPQSLLRKTKPSGLLDKDNFNITVSGGGLGVEVVPMTKEVLKSELPEDVAVHAIAAKDSKQLKELERMAKKDPRLHPHGFVPLAAMMREADVNVIRSHGTTFAETVAAGKPAVYYGPPRAKGPELLTRWTAFQPHLTTDTAEYGGKHIGNPVAIGLDKIPDALEAAVKNQKDLLSKSVKAKERMGNPAAQILAYAMKPRPEYGDPVRMKKLFEE